MFSAPKRYLGATLAIALCFTLALPAYAGEAMVSLDDCLAKAIAKEPPGRPMMPLFRDLLASCMIEVGGAKSELMKGGMSEDAANGVIVYQHVGIVAARKAAPGS